MHPPLGGASYTCEFHLGVCCVVSALIGDVHNTIHSHMEFAGITCMAPWAVQVIPGNSSWNALCCIRPHWGRIQRNTLPGGVHRCNLHPPLGGASYTCEFHLGVCCVVSAPNGEVYNAMHSQVEFIGVACTAPWAVQVIPMNSTVECVVLYTSPWGADTTQHAPKWSSQV